MSPRDFLSSIAVILGFMALASLLELAVPLFAADRISPRRGANLGMMAVTLLSSWALMSVAAVVALLLPFEAPGLMARASLPFWLQCAVGVVALDFGFGYLAHRSMHAWPLLWKFHRVHHSDPFVDVTTTYRTHPVESAWRYVFVLVPVAVLGIPAPAVVLYRLVSAINGIFEHANVCPRPALDSAISRLWVTPNMHKVHHSRIQTETDTNYGNLLSLYDRMLGTFTPGERAFLVSYGLADADEDEMKSTQSLLAMPWRSAIRRARGEAPMVWSFRFLSALRRGSPRE